LHLSSQASDLGWGGHLRIEELDMRWAPLEKEKDHGSVADVVAGSTGGLEQIRQSQGAGSQGADSEELTARISLAVSTRPNVRQAKHRDALMEKQVVISLLRVSKIWMS